MPGDKLFAFSHMMLRTDMHKSLTGLNSFTTRTKKSNLLTYLFQDQEACSIHSQCSKFFLTILLVLIAKLSGR